MNFSRLMITQLRVNDEYEKERKRSYKEIHMKTSLLMRSRHMIIVLGFGSDQTPSCFSMEVVTDCHSHFNPTRCYCNISGEFWSESIECEVSYY